MLARVVVENGVKKLVPLTADCGSGNPVGTVIAVYSNKVPNGYLPCNGVAFDTAQFPVLYALLGDDHTPDLRECTLKGIGESGRTVGAHVKTGGLAVGEFVDDRVQDLVVRERVGTGSQGDALAMTGATADYENKLSNITILGARTGATTEVKAVGVNWCIKATSGINENQADNVLSALSPVDTVASGNMQSVTSNAVAGAKYTNIFSKDLSASGWYKIASFSQRNIGSSISIELGTGYYYQFSGSHKIQINYGWLNANVLDFAQDAQTVFDKIRICYNSNNRDYMGIYVHYTPNTQSPIYLNINACTHRFIPINFETDSLTWENTIEYNLGTSGLYANGQKVLTKEKFSKSISTTGVRQVTVKTNIIPSNTSFIGNVVFYAVGDANIYRFFYGTLQIGRLSSQNVQVYVTEISKDSNVTLSVTVNSDNSITFTYNSSSNIYNSLQFEIEGYTINPITSIT